MAVTHRGSRGVIRKVAQWARSHLALWIVVGAAIDAALSALVSVRISLPGTSSTTISSLLTVLLVLLALSVAFPVAGHIVERRDRVAEGERQQRDAIAREGQARREQIEQLLLRGSGKRLPRLSELDDSELGVTPTRYSIEAAAPYVARREADHMIHNMLAAPGPPYPFIIVWGSTKVGKSRTLAEALRAICTDDPAVVLPRTGQNLAELARLNVDALADHRPAVVVLDDLDAAGLEALTPNMLGLIRQWAVIVATMTAQRRAAVLTTGGEVGAIARAALATVSGEYELAAGPPTGIEKAEAERLYPGERFDGSIAETLVGARELIARYKAAYDSDPAGCAVVRAAVDARRAGISRPVTSPELRRLFPLYLRAIRSGIPPTDDQFDVGIQWATQPVSSQVALLRPNGQQIEIPSWTVFDHVVTFDEGQGGQPRPVPDETWDELVDMLPPQDTFSVGMAAYAATKRTTALTAFRKVANSRDAEDAPEAALLLGAMLRDRGDLDGAWTPLRQAAESGHEPAASLALHVIGLFHRDQGDMDEARAAFQQAVDSGRDFVAARAAVDLGNLLRDQGDMKGARAAFQRAIDSGVADEVSRAGISLGRLLRDHGEMDGARAAFQKAIDSGNTDAAPMALNDLALLLEEQGDAKRAQAAFQKAIDSGNIDAAPMALVGLGLLLTKQGDMNGARTAYRRAFETNHNIAAPMAAVNLGAMLRKQGDVDEPRALFQMALDSGNDEAVPKAALNLGNLLRDEGDIEEARAAYQRAIDLGDMEASRRAKRLLDELE